MDPRPYNYEYRKPRHNNPTYQSPHLYDSIYHTRAYHHQSMEIQPKNRQSWHKEPSQPAQEMKEIQSESTLPGAGKGKMINVESTNKMSNYGNKIMHNQYSRREEDRVYERLEKPYNIVTNFPKEYQTVHRKFPKYSLEHQLIEQNKFPDIK